MTNLRSKLIRLAHSKPELRQHLLPLLTRVAGGESLLSEFLAEKDQAWKDFVRIEGESGRDSPETDAAYSRFSRFDGMRIQRSKSFPTDKTWETIEALYYKDVDSDSKLHAWASRISDGNTAIRIAHAGSMLRTGNMRGWYSGYFLTNWKSSEANFRVFGERVEKAATERFWELAGRGDRVKPDVPPSKKPVFVPPAIPPNLVPMTADGWELYSSVAGSGTAAKALGKSMAVTLGMVGRNVTPYNTDAKNAKNLQEITRRMGKILRTYQNWGALDTEPEGHVIDVLEGYLKLYLDRWNFQKTYDSLSRSYL